MFNVHQLAQIIKAIPGAYSEIKRTFNFLSFVMSRYLIDTDGTGVVVYPVSICIVVGRNSIIKMFRQFQIHLHAEVSYCYQLIR